MPDYDPLELLKLKQAAQLLCLSVKRMRSLCKTGELKSIKLDSDLRFRRSELERFICKRER